VINLRSYVKVTKQQVEARVKKNGYWKGIMVPNKCKIDSEFAELVEFKGNSRLADFQKKYNLMGLHILPEFGNNVALYEETNKEIKYE
jgi:hypothetical protein